MMFYGSIIIASLCAAGILSAIAAASPSNDIEDNAVSYLIGTSVSYCELKCYIPSLGYVSQDYFLLHC